MKDLAVVIPVRMGSSRVQCKPMLPFAGSTILGWKIEQILSVLPADQIFVSTDSVQLKQIASALGVQIHNRDSYLCVGNDATFSEVITGVVQDIPFDHIAWVTCTNPLMSTREYREGFQTYFEKVVGGQSFDSLMSVNLLKEYLWTREAPLNYEASRNHTFSQHLPEIYKVTNGLFMRRKEDILRDEYFLGPSPYKFEVSKTAGVDIDYPEDYEMALALYNAGSDEETRIYSSDVDLPGQLD